MQHIAEITLNKKPQEYNYINLIQFTYLNIRHTKEGNQKRK